MYKGESPFEASKRIIQSDFGIDSEPLGAIGFMHLPNENRTMEVDGKAVDFQIDSLSLVILARAKSKDLKPKLDVNAGWFTVPPVPHDVHTPFLIERGLLEE